LIKVLVFDFDGVLLESVSVKDQAFHELFEDATFEERKNVLALHQRTPGIHRRDKIALLMTEVLNRHPTPVLVNVALKRFKNLVWNGLMQCPEVEGVRYFLDATHKQIPCYVVSAAPHDELQAVARKRNFTQYFVDLFGSPPGKAELLQRIAVLEDVHPEEITLIGDKYSDLKAAQMIGSGFIGRVAPGDKSNFPAEIEVIPNFIQYSIDHCMGKR